MKVPRVRFTVRRLMVAAAVIAALLVLLMGERLLTRASSYGIAAGRYSDYADLYERNSPIAESCYGGRWDDFSKTVAQDIARHSKDKPYRASKSEHYRRLSRDYERAIWRPFLPVPPDPPAPE